jgi:hypothetical protein
MHPRLNALLLIGLLPINAAAAAEAASDVQVAVMAGLTQWTVWGGGNLAAELRLGRWVFEYSHGHALDLNRVEAIGLSEAERDAGVKVFMPWTTGGGFGYALLDGLHLLVEVKAHRFEVSGADRNDSIAHTTFTVGPGLFYTFHLGEHVFVQPNLRWWPNVGDTLGRTDTPRLRGRDDKPYAHETHAFPPFVNVNLGFSLQAPKASQSRAGRSSRPFDPRSGRSALGTRSQPSPVLAA